MEIRYKFSKINIILNGLLRLIIYIIFRFELKSNFDFINFFLINIIVISEAFRDKTTKNY